MRRDSISIRHLLLFLFGGTVFTIILVELFFRVGVEVKLGRDLKIEISKTQSMEFVWIEDIGMWVGKYEVTFGQYRCGYPFAASATQPRVEKHPDYYVGEENDHPVVMVGWKKAKKYCNWLNRHYRGLPERYQFRLPTEKEWKSFARCGDNRIYPWGNEWPPQRMKDGVYPNYQGEEHRWIGKENVSKPKPDTIRYIEDGFKSERKIIPNYRDGWKETCPVQKSGGNDWGLYGIGGNACEWTETCDPAGLRIAKGNDWGGFYPKRFKIVHQTVKERYGGFYIPLPFMTGKNSRFISSGFRVVIGPKLIGEKRFILYLVLVSSLVVTVSYLLVKRIRGKG